MNAPLRNPQPRTFRVLRIGVAVGLLASAVIHLQLAPGYQKAAPGGIGQGTLFLIQAGVAVLAALFVLLKASSTALAGAAVVAFSSLAAVIVYRYVPIPALGPIPSMYEPVWYAAKVATAVAETAAGALALAGHALLRKNRRMPPATDGDRYNAGSAP